MLKEIAWCLFYNSKKAKKVSWQWYFKLTCSFESVLGLSTLYYSYPLFERVLLNNSLELLKTVLLGNNLFVSQETRSGRFFIMLFWSLMYKGLLSGLLYRSYLPVDRFSVKSRKLATLRFVSLTMLRLNSFLNNLINAFLNFFAFDALVFRMQDKPSSL